MNSRYRRDKSRDVDGYIALLDQDHAGSVLMIRRESIFYVWHDNSIPPGLLWINLGPDVLVSVRGCTIEEFLA